MKGIRFISEDHQDVGKSGKTEKSNDKELKIIKETIQEPRTYKLRERLPKSVEVTRSSSTMDIKNIVSLLILYYFKIFIIF